MKHLLWNCRTDFSEILNNDGDLSRILRLTFGGNRPRGSTREAKNVSRGCCVGLYLSVCKSALYQLVMPPTVGKGAISVAFCPSVCLSVRPSVAYIANNSRTQRPTVPKFGRKVPHLRCDSHTSFKVKRLKVSFTDGRGHTVSAEPGGHTAC